MMKRQTNCFKNTILSILYIVLNKFSVYKINVVAKKCFQITVDLNMIKLSEVLVQTSGLFQSWAAALQKILSP